MLKARYVPVIAAFFAIGLALPSLGAGWMLDDYYHRTVFLERSQFRSLLGPPSAMFRFFKGDPKVTGRLVDRGMFPWWTDTSLKAEFLQALTVLTHRLDYALWPDSPVLMHAHSLLWLGASVALTAIFYRRILGATWVAGVAALLYAVDDARGPTVGFIANRNVLVAATFGVSALICHDRWRRDGSRPSALLALLLLAAALFSKEEGIGTCAYLGAYGLFIDRSGRWRGCLALLPYVAVVAAWRAFRDSSGYGVWNVGIYIDPVTNPGRYLEAAAERFPFFLLGQWGPVPADLGVVLRPSKFPVVWWVVAASLGLLALVLTPLLRRDRVARFWAAGMLFATLPVAATLPMDRLLTFAGIGAFGLMAQYLEFVFNRLAGAPTTPFWRVPARAVAWCLIAVHAIYAPLAFPVRAAHPIGPRWVEDRLYVRTPLGSSLEDRTVVVVNAPSPVNAGYLLLRRELRGQSVPRFVRVLAPAIPSVAIRRLDERTLAVRPKGGYLRWVLDEVFRSELRPLRLGEQVRLTGMTVTITTMTADGRPAEATFRFDVPLESPSLLWLCYRGKDFVPFTPPTVGQEVEIPFHWIPLLTPPWLTDRSPHHVSDEN